MVEVIAYITSITLISTIQAIANNMKPKNQAANGLTKFLWWLSAYFIIVRPFYTSFSTYTCMKMVAENRAIMIITVWGGTLLKFLFA